MRVSIEKGELVVRAPLQGEPTPSKSSGKTLIVASSYGPVTTEVLCPKTGKNITVSLNAYVKA